MNSTAGIKILQEEAIVREYVQALSRDDKILAAAILNANKKFISKSRFAKLVKKERGSGSNV